MPFDLDVRVVDRLEDRVQVTLRLAPSGDPTPLEGVTVELTSEDGSPLSPRMQLPLAGRLANPVATVIELRTHHGVSIPRDARVNAKAWHGNNEIVASCPAERCRGLESHVAGAAACFLLSDRDRARVLTASEHGRLTDQLPWIKQLRSTFRKAHGPDSLPIDPEPSSEDIAAELGLDGEDAAWLKELLDSDDVC